MKKNFSKKVLCFGDSNVYGFIPGKGLRYLKHSRWTGILQELGKEEYDVTEAGANNRTAFSDNPAGANLTGYKALPTILNKNYDIIILAIGANDLQYQYKNTLDDFKKGMTHLVNIAHEKCPSAKIILASPSVLTDKVLKSFFIEMFDEESIKKSHELANIYEEVAQNTNCKFIDLNKIAQVSPKDGLHYDSNAHEKIAQAIYLALKP